MSKDLITIDTFKVVTQAIAEIDDLEIMANYMCSLLVSSLDLKGCSIYLFNEDTNELELFSSYGLSSDYLVKGPVDAKKSIDFINSKQPVVVKDVSNDPRVQYPKQAEAEGIKSIIAVPIIFKDEVIGSLRLYTKDMWDISDQDLESLFVLAELMAIALNYGKFYTTISTIKELVNTI